VLLIPALHHEIISWDSPGTRAGLFPVSGQEAVTGGWDYGDGSIAVQCPVGKDGTDGPPNRKSDVNGAVMPPEVMALDIETDCAADAGSMVDGRQRHVVRALNIKCGPCVGSLWRSASQMPQETIRVARSVTAEEKDPGGGDAGLNRIRYRHRLLLHIIAARFDHWSPSC